MSTIVVVKKGQQVCIAADSQTTHGDMKQAGAYEESHRKIFAYGESYIGAVGSVAHELALLGALSEETYDLSSRQAIFESFCALHKTLKDRYYLNPSDREDDPYESSQMEVLIANASGIFGVYALREVFEYSRFWAIGTGGDFALGAMLKAYETSDDASEIARDGVAAGVEFDLSSDAPITLKTRALG